MYGKIWQVSALYSAVLSWLSVAAAFLASWAAASLSSPEWWSRHPKQNGVRFQNEEEKPLAYKVLEAKP